MACFVYSRGAAMSKKTKNRKGKLGQTKHNKQWTAEHKRHVARLWHGDVDKLTGKVIK
jgi:hypothetical protein